MRIGKLMVAVGILAIILSGIAYHVKRERLERLYRSRAEFYASAAIVCRRDASQPSNIAISKRLRDAADCFDALRQKWERAALRPWLPVESDPPSPE
jgi:hypothetical protein